MNDQEYQLRRRIDYLEDQVAKLELSLLEAKGLSDDLKRTIDRDLVPRSYPVRTEPTLEDAIQIILSDYDIDFCYDIEGSVENLARNYIDLQERIKPISDIKEF